MSSDAATGSTRPVVVGVDGLRRVAGTIDLAALEAARRGTQLLIVHVWPGRYRGAVRVSGASSSRDDGWRLLEVAERRAHFAVPDLPVRTELREGVAAAVLADCSAGARLLVTGNRDRFRKGTSWGSTAAYLARHSVCPLLVDRGADHDGPVVVASSARPGGTAALGYAFAEASLVGSRLVAVHMWTRPAGIDGSAPLMTRGGWAVERRAAADRLARAVDTWSGRFPEVNVEHLTVSDLDMAGTIEAASRRGRLLVGGIGRLGLFTELLYGPSGPTLCPVLLVPNDWPVMDRRSRPAVTC
ncbi:universal stress protein [Paractinoplanes durhamensis]|uniref:Universal stress protein n=1 Tax=Paractinoplanes durhamensis TaxID=113563 RepID=A0ABQ3YRP8_9ACTN|nr:universal stress protein [Actinoplanes durhamensis]GIE00202.1 universal stress protein [Actinoplanes durhamensis]